MGGYAALILSFLGCLVKTPYEGFCLAMLCPVWMISLGGLPFTEGEMEVGLDLGRGHLWGVERKGNCGLKVLYGKESIFNTFYFKKD